jgi:hypothetical protein
MSEAAGSLRAGRPPAHPKECEGVRDIVRTEVDA